MGFSESSVFLKASLIVVPIALLLQIIGVATNYWVANDLLSTNMGLWKLCVPVTGCDDIPSIVVLPDWWKATRAFGIIGILALVASIVLVVLCLFVFDKGQKMVYIINLIVTFVGAGAILLSIIIFGAKYNASGSITLGNDLGWSFGLSVAAGVIGLVSGCLLTADVAKSPSS